MRIPHQESARRGTKQPARYLFVEPAEGVGSGVFSLYRFRPVLHSGNVTVFVLHWPVRFLCSAVA
jgi:hypothetical protein